MAEFDRMPHPLPKQLPVQRIGNVAFQIAGEGALTLGVTLDQDQTMLVDPPALVWKEPSITITPREGLLELKGPGRFGVSRGFVGPIFPIPLMAGDVVQVQHGQALLSSGAQVGLDRSMGLGDRLTGGNGLVLDRFTAGVNGAVVWVQGQGSVFERGLIDGEVLDLRFGALLCKDAGVSVESLAPSNDKAARFEVACLRLTGAGRIAFQNSAASSPVGLPDAKPPARRAGLFSRAQG
jgi:uncharacterized protein (AIM24 family)